MKLTQQKVVASLRQHGYKLTSQRRAIGQVIASSSDHLTPADIYARLHQDHPNIGLVTIYRTLEILDKLGLICEVHAGGNCRSYLARRPAEHHHHLLCSNCGQVVDFANCELSKLENRLSRETGFKMEGHLLEFLGQCPACQKAA